jgi:RNA polymerase sigma-70 factor (ECF subfamily)
MVVDDDAEAEIRTAWDAGDHAKTARLVLDAYGDDVMAFLSARLRSQSDAAEAFSMFSEDFWVGLPSFQWRCSMRGWVYTLARNAANRYKTSPHNRANRNLALSREGQLSQMVEAIRTRTALHARTEVKSRLRELREQLPEDDQALLVLRVDQRLSWKDLAVVLHDGETAPSDAELEVLANRMRQRFETVKARLKKLVEAEGLA